MATCTVLRCTEEASAVFGVERPGVTGLEIPLCAHHKAAIDAGASWNWVHDEGHSQVLMGSDAPVRLKRFSVTANAATSEVGPGMTLRLELLREGEVEDILAIWVTDERARSLSAALRMFGSEGDSTSKE